MVIDEKIDDETFFEISALVLSINRKTFDMLASLKNFHKLSQSFTHQKIEKLDDLYNLQQSIILHLLEHRTASNVDHLHQSFDYLEKEQLLDKLSLEKLISLFDPSIFHEKEEIQIDTEVITENFHVDKQNVLSDISTLKEFVSNTDELQSIINYLNNQKFSIGITGVMNAGKSTMMNALMGKEVLGTSMIPETANLTIVKYSKQDRAKVFYWNKMQWESIENSASSDQAMRVFVDQTRAHFKEKLDSYILPESKEVDIDINDLNNYTSATHSDKKCNLVKCVELFTPLSFLEEGIEIVDTPGLDDIVIQREEITKEYLAKCDVMLHLMNVSQSATSKDVEFIIDAVLYQNITKVLVVITRIDMVSKKNVEEVIAYTKQSISKKLHEQNEESKLDFILKTIHFVAISGKMALLHKTGESKKALSAGYTLEDSGIVDIEDYLEDTIFGKENSRSSLIIRSAKNRLINVLNSTVKELKYEISLLFKSEDELQSELDALKQKKDKQLGTLKNLKQQIAGYEVEVSTYVDGLQYFLTNELKTLQSIIKQRLMDDVYYSLEKNKKAPPLKDQTRIIQTALKHGIIDIIREYRYKFIQKSSKVLETINLQYDEINGTSDDAHEDFDHQSVFGDAFNQGFLTSNNSALIEKISKVVDGAKSSNLSKIGDSVVVIIKDEFVYLEQQVKAKALEVSKTLLNEFFISLKEPIKTIENKLDHDEKVLEEHISFLDQSEVSSHDRSIKLHDQIKKIEQISKRYSL